MDDILSQYANEQCTNAFLFALAATVCTFALVFVVNYRSTRGKVHDFMRWCLQTFASIISILGSWISVDRPSIHPHAQARHLYLGSEANEPVDHIFA